MGYTSEIYEDVNSAELCGIIKSELVFSHKTYGENFYNFKLGIMRNSGFEDEIIVTVSERLLSFDYPKQDQWVKVLGQVRTYNEMRDGRNHLVIVVFAREMEMYFDEKLPCNNIDLKGYICKAPQKRVSPLGRQICDVILAVNRMYGKSDYIPCIAWGRNATFSENLLVGDEILIKGRLQSRHYRKKISENEVIEKIAYEVSILRLEVVEKV